MRRISITLPEDLLGDIDNLAAEVETDRSDVIETFMAYCFDRSEIVDEVFPFEEEEAESEEEEEEEGESED